MAKVVKDYVIEPGADLSGADLSGADLSGHQDTFGLDLSGADLSGADLSGADLTDAILTGVNLTNANLTGANLYQVTPVGIIGNPTLPTSFTDYFGNANSVSYRLVNGNIVGDCVHFDPS